MRKRKYEFDLLAFGMRLKKIREFHGETQEAVAEALGVSVKSVQNWENGVSAPAIDNLFSLADLFQMRVGEILQDEDYRLFHKRHKSRIQVLETIELTGKIETYAEIEVDNYLGAYLIWISDETVCQKRMLQSMDNKAVSYDDILHYIEQNADLFVDEFRKLVLSSLGNTDDAEEIRHTFDLKEQCEQNGMWTPGCMLIGDRVWLYDDETAEDSE